MQPISNHEQGDIVQEVHERVFVANEMSCTSGSEDLAVVHACKSPCHKRAVGYKGKLSNTHPNYLVLEQETNLYLNIIDPPVPLFKPPLFSNFLSFASKHWGQRSKTTYSLQSGRL